MNKSKQISEWRIYWKGGKTELLQGDKFYKSFLRKYPLSKVKYLRGNIWLGYIQ